MPEGGFSMSENKLELKKLCAKDLFPMMKIISKIGVSEFKKCFRTDSVKRGVSLETIGIEVMLDAADVLLKNIGSCEKDIYSFLGGLCNENPEKIAELNPAEFAQLIIDLVSKEEFKDFFTVVSGYFQKVN